MLLTRNADGRVRIRRTRPPGQLQAVGRASPCSSTSWWEDRPRMAVGLAVAREGIPYSESDATGSWGVSGLRCLPRFCRRGEPMSAPPAGAMGSVTSSPSGSREATMPARLQHCCGSPENWMDVIFWTACHVWRQRMGICTWSTQGQGSVLFSWMVFVDDGECSSP